MSNEDWYLEVARRSVAMANALQYRNCYDFLRLSWVAEDGEVPRSILDATFLMQEAFDNRRDEYDHDKFDRGVCILEEWLR